MFQAIAGKATEALGKAYLLTGLLPSVLLFLGVWCLWSGPSSLLESTNALLSTEKAANLTWLGLGIVAVSFAFMVTRRVIVTFLEELPSGLLKPLRSSLISRALRMRKSLEDRTNILDAEYSAVCWLLERRSDSMFVPPIVTRFDWITVRKESDAAIAVAYRLLRERPTGPVSLSIDDVDTLRSGLLSLFAFVADHPKSLEAAQAMKAWQQWFSNAPDAGQRILRLLRDIIQRDLAAAQSRLMEFPQPLWIKPTMLGNRFSVLEDYAEQRYKVATSTLWDHVWWVVPEKDRAEISDTQILIESLTAFTLSFGVLALIGLGLEILKLPFLHLVALAPKSNATELALVTALCALLAASSLHLARIPADAFSTKVAALIDIHRLTLLKALGYHPKTIEDELGLLKELNDFWIHGVARNSTRSLGAEGGEKGDSGMNRPRGRVRRCCGWKWT